MRTFPPYGVGPAVWGPYFWTTMHIVSLGYSPSPSSEEQEGVRTFYESLQVVIPCPICRNHYKQALLSLPLRTGSRNELVEWVYDIHNYVNDQLGKPQFSWEAFIAVMQNLSSPRNGSTTVTAATVTAVTTVTAVAAPLLLGIGIGIGIGYLRFRSTP